RSLPQLQRRADPGPDAAPVPELDPGPALRPADSGRPWRRVSQAGRPRAVRLRGRPHHRPLRQLSGLTDPVLRAAVADPPGLDRAGPDDRAVGDVDLRARADPPDRSLRAVLLRAPRLLAILRVAVDPRPGLLDV